MGSTPAVTWFASAFLLMLLGAPPPATASDTAAAPVKEDTCVACHEALGEPLGVPVEAMKNDIHAEKGLSCADCHGGDATAMDETAMAPEKGYRGVPKAADVPAFCGRCHADGAFMRRFNPSLATDQLSQYWISGHGRRLRRGDEKVATCVSCHGAHGILPADRSESRVFPVNVSRTCGRCHSDRGHMATYGIPTDQEERYGKSVHAALLFVQRDLSAPTCNDCHGNHGAFPPGVSSIAGVCGQCHQNNATLFSKSPHRAAFDSRNLPECAACHGNHDVQRATDAMLVSQDAGMCHRCHFPGSAGYAAGRRMGEAIERLKQAMSETEQLLRRARAMGMEVSDEEYAYREKVPPQLIKARTEIHLASADAVDSVVAQGITAAAASNEAARATLAEAMARRRNLLIPLSLIVLLIVLLYVKLRELERRDGSIDG
jgi:hypothetical protein